MKMKAYSHIQKEATLETFGNNAHTNGEGTNTKSKKSKYDLQILLSETMNCNNTKKMSLYNSRSVKYNAEVI